MRIIVAINKLGIGGAERLVADAVGEMRREGHDVLLLTFCPETESHSFLPEVAARHELVAFRSLYDIAGWRALVALLRREHADILITHLWFANTVGRIAGLCAHLRCVLVFEHNVYDEVKTWKQFFADRLLQRLSSRIMAVSGAVSDSLIRHGIDARRITVIENGIDLARYADARPADIVADGPLYLFVGRLIRQKGVDVLLDAFARVGQGRLLVAGGGPDGEALRAQAEHLGITLRVSFLGVRGDIPSLMKVSTCLILPSRWEGQGLVIPEAFASGTPVIAADFAAAGDMVTPENGIIVPREDAAALARAMMAMADDTTRARLASGASASAARFSIARHVGTLLSYVE